MAVDSVASTASGHAREVYDEALTERLLAHLPGSRWIWIAAWAFLPLMHHVVLTELASILGQPARAVMSWALFTRWLPSHAIQAYMIVVSFWAARKLTADVLALRPTISDLSAAHKNEASYPFAGLTGLAGPLVLTALVSVPESAKTAVIWGVVPALIFLPYQILWVLPIMTLFWVYIAFLFGLDRIGRGRMNLGPFPEDLSLGLGPVGTAVFNAFLIFCAITVPFLLVSLRDWVELTIGLAFFGAGGGAFFLSVWRLHCQMIETRRMHVGRAARLYAQAYEPLRARMTPATLEACAAPLSAAEGLARRALAIQEWPFDDRTMTRIVGISTGVATTVIARFVLSAIGL